MSEATIAGQRRHATMLRAGTLTNHLVAIGIARTFDQFRPGATTAFGPDVERTTARPDWPAGHTVWFPGAADTMRAYRDWLRLQWPRRPQVTDGDWLLLAAALDGLLALSADNSISEGWLSALATEGMAAILESSARDQPYPFGPACSFLHDRGGDGWAVALPYWCRLPWHRIDAMVRSAHLYHADEIGQGSLSIASWAIYPIADLDVGPVPRRVKAPENRVHVAFSRGVDGQWVATVDHPAGVTATGQTKADALRAVKSAALRAMADLTDQRKESDADRLFFVE